MKSFLAFLSKEIKEGTRNYKYLAIGLCFIILGIVDPLILKVLPIILKSQSSIDISQIMVINQQLAIQNYMKDLFQIVNIVIAFSLMGILAEEIRGKTLVFPYSKGVSASGMVIAKNISYSIVLPVMVFLGFLINYYYSGVLFPEGTVAFADVVKSASLFSIYYVFNISLITFLSSILKRGLITGFTSLGIILILMPLFTKINVLRKFIPYDLVQNANVVSPVSSSTIAFTIVCIIVYIILLNIATIYRMKKVEVI